MSILRRVTENQQSEWRPVPEGIYRWIIGKPELVDDPKYGKRVRFPLSLTEEERARVMREHPLTPSDGEGIQQSWRVSYRTGLSLGFVARTGEYRSTRLVDFLSAALGHESGKKFRKWIEAGNGPPRPADPDDPIAELDLIEDWLGWWEDLQVLGAVSHRAAESGVTYANFGGPLAIGSLPGQHDDEYQAFGRGKLRGMIAETETAQQAIAEVTAIKPAAPTSVVADLDRAVTREQHRQHVEQDDDLAF